MVFLQVKEAALPAGFEAVYSSATELWGMIVKAVFQLEDVAARPIMWACHQRFFASLCMSAKIDATISLARAALASGKCVVIGLQSTGESVSNAESAANMDDDVLASTSDGIVRSFLQRHCLQRGMSEHEHDNLIKKLECLQRKLPSNPLDELIDLLGGPSCVAEMTGRRHRFVRSSSGSFEDVSRGSGKAADTINIAERLAFQAGRKLVAVISQAASTGISLHVRNCNEL